MKRVLPLSAVIITVLAATTTTTACDDCTNANLVVAALNVLFENDAAVTDNGVMTLSVGDTIVVNGVERNSGSEDASQHVFGTSVRFQGGGSLTDLVLKDTTVLRLVAGGEIGTAAKYTLEQAGVYLVRAFADKRDQVCETSESDNVRDSQATSSNVMGVTRITQSSGVVIHVVGEYKPHLKPADFMKRVE